MHETGRSHLKVEFYVISVFHFRCFPPLDPRSHLDYKMLLHTYTTYVKGIFGLVGGNRVVKTKD